MMKIKYLGLLLMVLWCFASCKRDDLSVAKPNEAVRPAADFIKNNYEMTLFSAALEKTGYKEQLNGPGPFTVLVPTDAAFNEMGIYRPEDFDEIEAETLKKMIGYHILNRRLRVSDIPVNGVDVRYPTLEGSEIYTSIGSVNPGGGTPVNKLYFSGSDATRKDVVLANGVLHVLGKVMKPAFNTTTQQWLEQHADYSVFVAGLKKFNLWSQLAVGGPYTIFAPDNKALEEVGITEASLNEMDVSHYKGERLFGAYLLYDRHFFISDFDVFSVINSNGRYNYFLKDDGYYMEVSAFSAYPSFRFTYVLVLRTGNTVYDAIVKNVSTEQAAKTDNLCSNGLVHHLASGLVRPEQALKN